MERDTEVRLTVLTVLILLLISILIIYTGVQAVSTERSFFRDLTFEANRAVSKMVAREFLQVFSNMTGWVENMAQFPAVKTLEPVNSKRLFEVMLRSHSSLRALYLLDTRGKTVVKALGPSVRSETDYRALTPAQIAYLQRPGGNYMLTDPYFVEAGNRRSSPLAITYAVKVEDEKHAFGGILGTEVGLDFIQDVLTAVQVGQTGQILVVSRPRTDVLDVESQAASRRETMPEVIFTSPSCKAQDIDDFRRIFPIAQAYQEDRVGFEYEGAVPKMASYARLQTVAVERAATLVPTALPVSVSPSRSPDWLVVVQQATQEGYMVADRLKYNVIVLVIVGLGGLALIAKLWIDSMTA